MLAALAILIAFTCLVLFVMGELSPPTIIVNNQMYVRVMEKIHMITGEADRSHFLRDRGWTRIVNNAQYFIYGAGEGACDRFGTQLEIHSSIIGPLFYYGLVPFCLFVTWTYSKIKGVKYYYVYLAFFTEALFLANTRQPMYWMIISLAGIPLAKRRQSDEK